MGEMFQLTENQKIKKILKTGLEKVGLQPGDLVLIHSDASPVMELGSFKWGEALSLLRDCLIEIIGPTGTMLVPTFNYNFCKGTPYTHDRTLSQVGIFSNFILGDERCLRSFHPIFSFAGIGPQVSELFDRISKSSFGENSVFHKLHQFNAKLLFFQAGFISCTFIHYVEQKVGVDYRFLKRFMGKVKKEGEEFEETVDFFVRHLDREVVTDLSELEKDLFSQRKMKREYLIEDKYPVLMVGCNDVAQVIQEKIGENPYYLLKSPPRMIIA